jgi:hypothetical protein
MFVLRLVPLALPSTELAGYVVLALPDSGQPHLVDVDGVQGGHGVDKVGGKYRPRRLVE